MRRLLRVPWTGKEIKPVNPEGNQPWIFMEGLMLKLKFQYFSPLMWSANSLEKTLMLGMFEGKSKKGMAEDKMIGWYHQLNGYEFERSPGDSEGQGSLECCSPWGPQESDMPELLSNN